MTTPEPSKGRARPAQPVNDLLADIAAHCSTLSRHHRSRVLLERCMVSIAYLALNVSQTAQAPPGHAIGEEAK